jgi:DNA primase
VSNRETHLSLDDVKNRILSGVTLRDLVGETVALVERSGKPVGCCPFHAEKSPSFYIYDDRYHCFGCKANGDAIEFVRQSQGLSFIETLKYLAGKYGIEAPELERSAHDLKAQKKSASQYKMMVEAHTYYQAELQSPRGESARKYLVDRGFTEDNIKEFEFGMTPQEGYGLVQHLRKFGYRDEDMIECGLATSSNRGGRAFDFFRARLMIPIKEPQGRVIAFGGRTLDGHKAKYMNSRDSKMYDKGRTLFGFDRARKNIRSKKYRAIVCEGYMDTLQLWNQGFSEAVACLGTAFTEQQLKLLSHATTQVYLLFDGDSAGRNATLGTINVALSVPSVEVKAVVLPNGQDPDDFVRNNGVEALEAELENAQDLLEFAINEKLKTTHKLGIPDLINKEIVPWLAKISDPVQKSFLVNRVSQLTGVPIAHIESSLAPQGRPTQPPVSRMQPHNQFQQQNTSAPGSQFDDPMNQPPMPGEEFSGAGAMQEDFSQGNNIGMKQGGQAQPQQVRSIKPLTPQQLELFGHVFYSEQSEIDLKAIYKFVHHDLEIDQLWSNFMDEMLQSLKEDKSPHIVEKHAWASSLSESVAVLIERFIKAKTAYETSNRSELFSLLTTAHSAKKAVTTIKHLKAELSRLSAVPGAEDEVINILTQISEISKDIDR